MFELNLIKDKAKARQRRRVIFLTITSVCFLAALSSLFVLSLWWAELQATNLATQTANNKQAELTAMKANNDVEEPKAQRRRNALIEAWGEDTNFLLKRPYYTTALLNILSTEQPGSKFWYSTIEVRLVTSQLSASAAGGPQAPQVPRVLSPRQLTCTGLINITESDIRTEQQLFRLMDRMNLDNGFVALVGVARATLNKVSDQPGSGQGGGQASRWNEFEITASKSGSANLGP